MSIPLDRLYHYIESIAQEVYGDVIIYRFWPHGSKKIEDLLHHREISWLQLKVLPEVICYDQEPLAYDQYQHAPAVGGKHFTSSADPELLLPKRNLRRKIGNIYDQCVLIHSEQRSENLKKYQDDQFIPVYYWSHGIIARDWFRYAKFETFKKEKTKPFLIYNRAWSGAREYRIKFADLLIENRLVEHCQTNFNVVEPETGQPYQVYQFKNQQWMPVHRLENYFTSTHVSSSASADFDSSDYNSTDFEVVLETLFDDSRIHLTEKSLRPIACRQPFILATTHGSLEYLRSYGFQTFDSVIDETYDLIVDPYQRMQAIVNTMKQIVSWTAEERSLNMEKIKKITEFNQQHFFSDNFFNTIQFELKNNLSNALEQLESTNTCQEFLKLDRLLMKDPVFNQSRKPWRMQNISRQDQITLLHKIKHYRQQHRKKLQG